jgi:hypothetical protein
VSFGVRLLLQQAGKSSDVAAAVEDEEWDEDAEEEDDDGEQVGSWDADEDEDEEWDEDDEETITTLDDDDDTSPRGSSDDDDDDDDDFLFARILDDDEETTAVVVDPATSTTTTSSSLWFDDETTYVELIRSSSQQHPERLPELWTAIPKEKRTVSLYNAYLAASNAAAASESGGQSTMKPKQAEALMYGMIRAGLAPNVETIHHVMQCYVTSTIGLPALKIEQFLTLAQNSNSKTVIDIPDSTYTLALQALSYHTTCPRKATKAASLLSRLQEQPPCIEALRNAIRSCASIPVDSYPEDKIEAFRIGYEFYEKADQLIKMRLHGNILQLAANLLTPGSDKLNALAQQIFAQAQTDGTANAFCIAQFRRAASSKVQLQIFGGDFDDLVRLPPSWSRNDGDVPEVAPKNEKQTMNKHN